MSATPDMWTKLTSISSVVGVLLVMLGAAYALGRNQSAASNQPTVIVVPMPAPTTPTAAAPMPIYVQVVPTQTQAASQPPVHPAPTSTTERSIPAVQVTAVPPSLPSPSPCCVNTTAINFPAMRNVQQAGTFVNTSFGSESARETEPSECRCEPHVVYGYARPILTNRPGYNCDCGSEQRSNAGIEVW